MSDHLSHFIHACQAANPVAAASDHPPFTAAFRGETPLNSAPYIYDMTGFRTTFGTSDHRRRIIAGCEAALDRLRRGGVDWQMLLVGGSFIRSGDSPSDLDGLVLYSIDSAGPAGNHVGLAACLKNACSPLVDLKYCPVDVHPVVLVKRVAFFSSLFGYDRESQTLCHGTVMLVPDPSTAPARGSMVHD